MERYERRGSTAGKLLQRVPEACGRSGSRIDCILLHIDGRISIPATKGRGDSSCHGEGIYEKG